MYLQDTATALVLSGQYLMFYYCITFLCIHSYFIVAAVTNRATKQLYDAIIIVVVS